MSRGEFPVVQALLERPLVDVQGEEVHAPLMTKSDSTEYWIGLIYTASSFRHLSFSTTCSHAKPPNALQLCTTSALIAAKLRAKMPHLFGIYLSN